jgi:hypothetical protein
MPTLTFNPDGDPETTSVDGSVRRTTAGNFSTIRTSAGNTATDDGASNQAPVLEATTNSDEYGRMDRGVFLFDTSSLPDGAEIISATFELYVSAKTDGFSGGAISLVTTTPASNTALVAADYNIANWSFTKQATDLTIASITTSAYNTWTLNANGLASISKTGITKFGLVTAYDADNSAPTWSSAAIADLTWNTANGTNKPKLNVTFTASSGLQNKIW